MIGILVITHCSMLYGTRYQIMLSCDIYSWIGIQKFWCFWWVIYTTNTELLTPAPEPYDHGDPLP